MSLKRIRVYMAKTPVIAVGIALGLLIPASRAACVQLKGWLGGNFLFGCAVLGLLAGMSWVGNVNGRMKAFLELINPLMVALFAAGVYLSSCAPPAPLMNVAVILVTLCLPAVFFRLGQAAKERFSEGLGDNKREVSHFLIASGIGVAVSTASLSLVGPFVIFALVVIIMARMGRISRIGPMAAVLPSLLILVVIAFLDRPAGQNYVLSRFGEDSEIISRVWYTDGPAEIARVEDNTIKASLSGGRISWSERKTGNDEEAQYSTSMKVAFRMYPGGSFLAVGPSAEAELLKAPPESFEEKVAVIGDDRLARLHEKVNTLSAVGSLEDDIITGSYGIRTFLAGEKGRFGLIYYVDPFDPPALAKGAVGSMPAYHLTVESLRTLIGALKDNGIIIMEIPYGLKVVSILKELEKKDGLPLPDSLMVLGQNAGPRNIVILGKKPLARDRIGSMIGFAKKARWRIFYRPKVKGYKNSVYRLVRTEKPWGFYAGVSEEISAPRDDRPFFYQIQKIFPRTRTLRQVGMYPEQASRVLGLFPAKDFSWFFFSSIGMLLILAMFFRSFFKKLPYSVEKAQWQHRFLIFFILYGASLAIFVQGTLMMLMRNTLAGFHYMPMGLAFALALPALVFSKGGIPKARGNSSLSWQIRFMLPAMMLPYVAGELQRRFSNLLPESLAAATALAPALWVGSIIALVGLAIVRRYQSFEVGGCLAAVGLGALIGRELAAPLSQTFSFQYTLTLAWVMLFISVRILRRVPAVPQSSSQD